MSARALGDLRQFQIRLSQRLLVWSLASLLVGGLLVTLGSRFWAAFGIQSLAWGGIDAATAAAGLAFAAKRHAPDEDPGTRARRLRRLLWINTLLDVLYTAAGLGLVLFFGGHGPAWRGHGCGLMVQGAFLLFFDLIHAQSVPPPIARSSLREAFGGPEHLAFRMDESSGGPAALLVHGFPGTPAEMHPLAEVLHREGWSVEGLLLPGFGPQIGEIAGYRWADWRRAVESALAGLAAVHHPLLLVGHSLGGALAAAATHRLAALAGPAESRPQGLVLLAPFWRLGSPLQRLIGRVLAPFLPRYFQPLAKADFADPRLLESLRRFLPGADLADPAVQEQLREAHVPVSIIREIFACGRTAFARRRARRLGLPTLVLQGRSDSTVRPEHTRRLLRRLGGPAVYREVDAGHDLLDPRTPGWAGLVREVTGFAAALRAGSTAAGGDS
jgi:carboxylesterase